MRVGKMKYKLKFIYDDYKDRHIIPYYYSFRENRTHFTSLPPNRTLITISSGLSIIKHRRKDRDASQDGIYKFEINE